MLLLPIASLLGSIVTPSLALSAEPSVIEILPLGGAPGEAEVRAVIAAIQAFFTVPVEVREPWPLPKPAYYPARGRYRAERLLEFLAEHATERAHVALGLTTVDISTTKGRIADWGILGLATLDGRSAVLSSFRCQRGARDASHARERFAKTAVHELGHSFGLPHCATPGCLMHDGEGSVLTSDREADFCDATRARLAAAGVLRSGAVSPFTAVKSR